METLCSLLGCADEMDRTRLHYRAAVAAISQSFAEIRGTGDFLFQIVWVGFDFFKEKRRHSYSISDFLRTLKPLG